MNCTAQHACVLRSYRLEIDNLGKFGTEYTETKDKALSGTQDLPCHRGHSDYITKQYTIKMQGVAVMSDMADEKYSKALSSELSTNNKEHRPWVQKRFENFPILCF